MTGTNYHVKGSSIWHRKDNPDKKVVVLEYGTTTDLTLSTFLFGTLDYESLDMLTDEQGIYSVPTIWNERESLTPDDYLVRYPRGAIEVFDLNTLCELFDRDAEPTEELDGMEDIAEDIEADPMDETQIDDGGD